MRNQKKMKNEKLYRESWSLFPTGVSVVGVLDNKKNVHGMTANSISSISLNPNIATYIELSLFGHYSIQLS